MFTGLQVRFLKTFFPGAPGSCDGSAYLGKSKLDVLLGAEYLARLAGKTVVDFGCGEGADAVEMVKRGAKRVIGIDIREDVLRRARQAVTEECKWPNCGPTISKQCIWPRCSFTLATEELADVIVSIDAFEHFSDPGAILRAMYELLKPAGEVLISFGPTWYHPLGGHLFSVFPWAHLLLSERALIEWRSSFKTDGATRFGEVAGGLNQMTITQFERLVEASPFRIASLTLVPIRPLRRCHNRWTREFTTATVRCRLVKSSIGANATDDANEHALARQ